MSDCSFDDYGFDKDDPADYDLGDESLDSECELSHELLQEREAWTTLEKAAKIRDTETIFWAVITGRNALTGKDFCR